MRRNVKFSVYLTKQEQNRLKRDCEALKINMTKVMRKGTFAYLDSLRKRGVI